MARITTASLQSQIDELKAEVATLRQQHATISEMNAELLEKIHSARPAQPEPPKSTKPSLHKRIWAVGNETFENFRDAGSYAAELGRKLRKTIPLEVRYVG